MHGEVARTRYPRRDNLKSIDHLGIEARRELNSHTCWKEDQVEISQVWLPIPPYFVLIRNDGHNGL